MFKLMLTILCNLFFYQVTFACTDFRIVAKDGTVLVTRSMEFAYPLNSNLRNMNRNHLFTTTTPNNKPGLSWKTKYGYLYVDGMEQDFAVDGLNEQGLSFEYLYLPGETQYQAVPSGKENQAIPYFYLGDYLLGNFKSIDEVRSALQNLYVYSQTLATLGNNMVFPVHAAIFDASGKGIVVEFVKGQMRIHDNVGVMTNSPVYEWHVANLRNYLNLSPYNPNPVTINGFTFTATGQGAGMVGLPGDVSPPSRFVKTSFMLKVSYPVSNQIDALNLAQHIINNVDIPNGLARSKSGNEVSDWTQWVVFKDLTHKIFYYRTYNDLTLRSIAMSKVNFAENAAPLKMSLTDQPYVMDKTTAFNNAK